MISSWNMKRFKSVYECELKIAPLTIFAGANSSGKSSVLQSILMVTQTLQNPVYNRPIILNGNIVKLGSFEDIVFNNKINEKINVGFSLSYEEEKLGMNDKLFRFYSIHSELISNIQYSFEFSSNSLVEKKEITNLHPILEECKLLVETRDEKNNRETLVINRTKKDIQQRINELKLNEDFIKDIEVESLEYEVTQKNDYNRIKPYDANLATGKPVGAVFQHFFPEMLAIVFDVIDENTKMVIDSFMNLSRYYVDYEYNFANDEYINKAKNLLIIIIENFLTKTKLGAYKEKKIRTKIEKMRNDFELEDVINIYNTLQMKDKNSLRDEIAENIEDFKKVIRGGRKSQFKIKYIPLSSLARTSIGYTRQFFNTKVKYLGPLRDEPKPVYPLALAISPDDIGYKGENTAAVLEINQDKPIRYIPTHQFQNSSLVKEVVEKSLMEAVLDWLDYLGVANNIITQDKGKYGHELKVTTDEGKFFHDLTHVGVGVSQVLPIIVMSLLAKEGSTLIFEQPELHLHPRVQVRLADFFISMISIGKQCIVETHSEYLINRLRLLSVISDKDNVSKDIAIYFVEKEKQRTSFRELKINKFGVIDKWPNGFFDENERNAEEILKAGMNKKLNELRGKND